MKILAIGAHLDDIELSCGGTLFKAASRGDEIKLVVVTHSAYKALNGKVLRTKSEAAVEGKNAARKLGIKNLQVLGFQTKKLIYNDKLVEAIEKPLVNFRPDLVFTHWAYDTHQDHRSVALASLSAARYFSNILMYEPFPPSAGSYEAFQPQIYSDISETMEEKILAMKEHKSQLDKYGPDWIEAVIGRARVRGFECREKYAEAFEVVRLSLDNFEF